MTFFSPPTPSCESCPLLAQHYDCQNGIGLLALMHSTLQVLEKNKYMVPQEKAKTQADVKMDLDALFHLPAALRGSFTHISYLFPSHHSGVENAQSPGQH